tara:strand:+ start:131 stop:556 length:426 start_codon:yes stop_codon:yes gene_type:complete
MGEVQQVEQMAQELIGTYGWMAFGAFAMFFFKDLIQSIAEGISLMMGNDINQDDVIYISGRKARVVRVGLRKTIFYMRDRGTKMIIPNTQLKKLTLEKKLLHNGDHSIDKGSYLKKSTENGKSQKGLHVIEKEFSVMDKKK